MTARWLCCCADGGCIYGWRVPQVGDPPTCAHTTGQELLLRIPRPSYAYNYNWMQWQNVSGCQCLGIDIGFGYQAPAASDIVAKYSHYNGTGSGSPQAGEDFPWFYDNGGLPGTGNFDPSQLWPWTTETKTEGVPTTDGVSGCCGFDQGAGSPDDSLCAGNSYNGAECSGYMWYPDIFGNRRYCTRLMEDLINTNTGPKISPTSTAIDVCEYPAGTWDWLQGISDNPINQLFQHWEYDGTTGAVIPMGANYHLAETLLCVAHQEKWWERYFNSITDEYPGNPGTCRTPGGPGWAFSCGGIPIFTWEIMQTHKAALDAAIPSTGGLSGAETIIKTITEGTPLTSTQCAGLVSVGLFQLADWGQTNGEPIKKTVEYKIGRAPYSQTRYYFARPGGWSYSCNDTPQNLQNWPQLPRGISTLCANIWGDDFPGWGDCMSAAPFPNPNQICNPGVGNCQGLWNGCNLGPPPGCSLGTITIGLEPIEAFAAECNGVLFRYGLYARDNPSGGIDPWSCVMHSEATLCVVNPGGTNCKLNLPVLRAALEHFVPEEVSDSVRSGHGTTVADLCCGGQGLYNYFGVDCPATTPNATGC